MGVYMLFLVDKSSLIQAYVSIHRLNSIRELLREGAMYEVSGFDVIKSNNLFKLRNSIVAIRLNEYTKFVEVPVVANRISQLRCSASGHNSLAKCFGPLAELLHKRLETGVVHPRVTVVTTINFKFVGEESTTPDQPHNHKPIPRQHEEAPTTGKLPCE
ncbi:hypothetical protein Bca52824_030332 [Brassica carinata]|uniref:Uncharacterized protein n=1 Tax=Brassica carinata TaxID=52824 RepID=A0A8X7V5H2_BRACI|nr:hypothetical protein Bca52824_030332 [Brassica carinata]